MTVICDWTSLSKALVQDLVNPGLVDILALARTMPRDEIFGTALGRRIRGAVEKAERRIKNAAGQLELFRVFAVAHPDVRLRPINTSEAVAQMVRRAMSASGNAK